MLRNLRDLIDALQDHIALGFAKDVVESPNQAISGIGHRVDLDLRWCTSGRWDELVVVGDLTNVADDGGIELHVKVLLTKRKSGPIGHCVQWWLFDSFKRRNLSNLQF